MSIRAHRYSFFRQIYKSRNWICLLEIEQAFEYPSSTKVEIGYVYQRAGLALTGAKDAINR